MVYCLNIQNIPKAIPAQWLIGKVTTIHTKAQKTILETIDPEQINVQPQRYSTINFKTPFTD